MCFSGLVMQSHRPVQPATYLCVVPPLVCLLRLQTYQLFHCQLNPQDACNLLGLFQMLNLVLEHEQSDNCNWFTRPLAKNTQFNILSGTECTILQKKTYLWERLLLSFMAVEQTARFFWPRFIKSITSAVDVTGTTFASGTASPF